MGPWQIAAGVVALAMTGYVFWAARGLDHLVEEDSSAKQRRRVMGRIGKSTALWQMSIAAVILVSGGAVVNGVMLLCWAPIQYALVVLTMRLGTALDRDSPKPETRNIEDTLDWLDNS